MCGQLSKFADVNDANGQSDMRCSKQLWWDFPYNGPVIGGSSVVHIYDLYPITNAIDTKKIYR